VTSLNGTLGFCGKLDEANEGLATTCAPSWPPAASLSALGLFRLQPVIVTNTTATI